MLVGQLFKWKKGGRVCHYCCGLATFFLQLRKNLSACHGTCLDQVFIGFPVPENWLVISSCASPSPLFGPAILSLAQSDSQNEDVLVRIQTQSRLRCAKFCLVPMAGTLEIVSLLLITLTLPQTHQHRRAHKHSVVGYCYWLEADAVRIACLVWRRLAFSFVRFFPLTKTTSYQSVTVKICILISHKYLSVAVPLELLFTLPSK